MLENHDLIGALMGEWALQSMHLGAILLRVCMALFLSAMIGCERATKGIRLACAHSFWLAWPACSPRYATNSR